MQAQETQLVAAPKPALEKLLEPLRAFGKDMAGLHGLLRRTLYFCFKGKQEPGSVAKQMYSIGNESLLFITVTMSVVGMIMVVQSGLQTKKVLPESCRCWAPTSSRC